MKRMMLRVTGLMVLVGGLSVATAQADSHFSIHVGVGAPVAVAPGPYGYGTYVQAPYPGYVWQPGYYVGSRWVVGGWVPRGRYVARRWDRHDYRRTSATTAKRSRHNWDRSDRARGRGS